MEAMRYPGRKTTLACAIAAVCAMVAGASWAQEPPAAPAAPAQPDEAKTDNSKAAQSDQIETITVTAQKRKEDPNKVAMSITALRGTDLQADHVSDFTDLTRSVPNISFTAASGNGGAGPGTENIEIRGISSAAGAATVGVYLDDTSITVGNVYSMGTVEPKFFDIDRVEVLRGPQGTLYGASSMGGTIKFIANQPQFNEKSFETYTEVSNTKGGSMNYSGYAVANIPLAEDTLALRIGAQVEHQGGFVNQVDVDGNTMASDINKIDDQELRLSLKWKPTHDLTLTPALYYQKIDAHDIGAFTLGLPDYEAQKPIREPSTDTLFVPSLNLSYSLDSFDVTSVTSYFQRKFDRIQNGSLYNSYSLSTFITPISAGGTAPEGLADAVAALPSAVFLDNQVRQFSEELRFSSKEYDPKGSSPWTWVGGTYVSTQHTNIVENDPIYGVTSTFNAFGVSVTDPTILPGAYPGDFPNDDSFFGEFHYRERQTSIFGDVSYYFTPTLHATVGARYLKATDTLSQDNALYLAGAGNSSSVAANSTAFTPKYSLTWEVNPTNTLYGSVAKGFRLGGDNTYVPSSICGPDLAAHGLTDAPTTYGPDSLWSYEIGNKSRFFGNKLSINADVFYVNWKNIQQDVYLPTCTYTYEQNAGDAVAKGFEFELKAKPISGLTIGLSGGYVKAYLTNSVGSDNGVPGAVTGATIEGVPKFNASAMAQYNFSLGEHSAFVLGNLHWVGSSRGSLDPTDTDYDRPGYYTADFSTGVSVDKLDFSFYIKNAFDNDTVIQHPRVASIVEGYRVFPRTIGLSLAAKF
jgi:outer membrane receptor protein involved in Fe transport